MTSLNHHFWGNVSSWFIQALAGIRCFPTQNPKKVCIQPFFPDGMTFAEGWHQTPQGRVFVRWGAQTHRSVCILKCRTACADGLFWRADTNLPIRERRNDRWKAEAFFAKRSLNIYSGVILERRRKPSFQQQNIPEAHHET